MRKFMLIALLLALGAGPAYAQQVPEFRRIREPETERLKDEAAKRQAAEADKAHRSSMERIPEAKPADPWATIRPAAPAASSNKPAR